MSRSLGFQSQMWYYMARYVESLLHEILINLEVLDLNGCKHEGRGG